MNRTETRQYLIEHGIAAARLPIDGQFDLSGAVLRGANLSGANLSGAHINWQSHDLIAGILLRAAADNVSRRMLAGLILISHDWCWNTFLALDIDPALRDWALTELRRWVTDGDNAPGALRPPVSDQSTPPAA